MVLLAGAVVLLIAAGDRGLVAVVGLGVVGGCKAAAPLLLRFLGLAVVVLVHVLVNIAVRVLVVYVRGCVLTTVRGCVVDFGGCVGASWASCFGFGDPVPSWGGAKRVVDGCGRGAGPGRWCNSDTTVVERKLDSEKIVISSKSRINEKSENLLCFMRGGAGSISVDICLGSFYRAHPVE